MFLSISWLLELFAVAGGGGSSSGGGGSSGSSSGGSGSGIEILFFVGYGLMHVIGAFLRKKTKPVTANILGWSIFLVVSILFTFLGFYGWIMAFGAIFGTGSGLYNWFNFIAKKIGITKQKHELALKKDSSWDIKLLNDQTAKTFAQFQADWSNNDTSSMGNYLSLGYLKHNELMVMALRQLNRRNVVNHPTITRQALIDISDVDDNTQDRYIMLVTFSAEDTLYDTKNNELLYSARTNFQEYWKFIRSSDSKWLLEGISQMTEDPYMRNNVMAQFALTKKYYYSPDWGWLLLPRRGQLFGSGKFGTSDINNHIIGQYKDILIQLYNYIPSPSSDSSASSNYIIAQVALPKSYGNIVVRKKRLLSFVGTKDLKRVTMEWGDFNKRYEVWASDMERVTSFELLNPSFMVKLQELPFEVNIEVVDNIVYLYSSKISATPQTYETMLGILDAAFKEMRM